VAKDKFCIVDPRSYEIVDVIPVSGQTAARGGQSGRLHLTEEEKQILLREVEVRQGSTLGLGSLAEGPDVAPNVEVRCFPDQVVRQIPKLQGHKYLTAEDKIVIVDPGRSKVEVVTDNDRSMQHRCLGGRRPRSRNLSLPGAASQRR
jgi:hypothetical protein